MSQPTHVFTGVNPDGSSRYMRLGKPVDELFDLIVGLSVKEYLHLQRRLSAYFDNDGIEDDAA